MSSDNSNKIYNYENTSSKQDLTYQIDDIINKYKSQLAELKTNSSKNSSFISDTMQKKIITNEISPNLSKEIQNDNIKLQSLLTEEKIKSTKLKAQIDHYEYELNKAKQELTELNEIVNNREKEYIQKMNDMEAKINNDINDKNNIINENSLNKNIIQNFFELYNKYLDIFYKSKIISFNNQHKLNYSNNESEENKYQLAIFVLNNFDILIQKLLQDNKELYTQMIEIKKIMDEQNNIQRELEMMKGIKEENTMLKIKIQKLNNENNALKNSNLKLKRNLIELNNYLGNKLDDSNYINSFKQIKRNISNNDMNYLNNYRNQGNNSYSQNNSFYNMDNKNFKNKYINNDRHLKNRRDFNKTSENKSMNYPINNKRLSFQGIHTNYSDKKNILNNDKIYSKTDENNINNYIVNNEMGNITNTNINNSKTNAIIFSGFERPIEKLKKKIMILEQQIKNNSE